MFVPNLKLFIRSCNIFGDSRGCVFVFVCAHGTFQNRYGRNAHKTPGSKIAVGHCGSFAALGLPSRIDRNRNFSEPLKMFLECAR